MNTCTAGVRECIVVRHALVTLEPTDARFTVALSTGDVTRTVVWSDWVAVTLLASYRHHIHVYTTGMSTGETLHWHARKTNILVRKQYAAVWQEGRVRPRRAAIIQIFVMGSEKCKHFETECTMAVQAFKVIQGRWFWYHWKRLCNFLLIINSILDSNLSRFRDITGFLSYPTLFPWKTLGCSPGIRLWIVGPWRANTLCYC